MATTTKTRKQTEIQAPVIHRVVDKLTKHCYGYLVKSDSSDEYYQVSWNRSTHQYQCSCPATTKSCKHIRSVQSVLAAKKQLQAPRRLAAFFAAMATVAQQQVASMAVQEAQEVVQPPQRYCDACSCVGRLELADGLLLCQTCAEATRPAPIEPPAPVAAPTIAKRENAPLGNNRTFSLSR